MDRRTFVLLTGGISGSIIRPSATTRDRPRPPGRTALGRLRFELDDQRRWSLWYYGDGSPVPLIRGGEVVIWVGDQSLTLAQLEDSTVGSRRPPGGEAVVVRGRAAAAGVWIEAEFLAIAETSLSQAAVTVTVFPDRFLPTVKGVRFFQVPSAETLAGEGPMTALLNGLHSNEPCRVVTLEAADGGELTSHGAFGLSRGGRGLAIAFDSSEPGTGHVSLTPDQLEAVSDWLPPRPLRPEGDASRLRLCLHPAGDGLDALRALFEPASPVDRERLQQAVAPAGWCSRSEFTGSVGEAEVIANLDFCAGTFDRRYFRNIELDDGYQRAAGDWEPNQRFPHGHAWLTDQIHAKGFKAGLWLAPFAVAEGSGLPTAQPDWLLRDASGPVLCDTRDTWGGKVYALDAAHPKVQQWLYDLARRAVRAWGYDYLRVDQLRFATVGTSHYGGLTHAEAYRAGLGALRDGLGTEALLIASAAPLQHSVGLVNGMRVGPDVEPSWAGLQPPARAVGLRSFYHRSSWLNDPDCLVVRSPLTRAGAETWASLVAIAGGLTLFSDDLPKLPGDRIGVLQRTVPVAPVAGRPIEAVTAEREIAPAIVAGSETYPIARPWHFRTGDDPSYASREFDEDAWETITVPRRWSEAGHPGYAGVAWYRTRFSLPPRAGGSVDARTAYLELGKIEDADETFINGAKIGQTGAFPPGTSREPQAFRRYHVAPENLNWGGENVLAVRVAGGTGGEGGGGIWSVRRGRPPHAWMVEGGARWWTVVLVNWEDEPRELSLPLSRLGITGTKFDAYDVWHEAPIPGLQDNLTLALEPRSSRSIAIRAAATRPQLIGTSRHVVQGAVDIVDETWDAATRTLKAKSVNLDGRVYTVTIAVPKRLRPGSCRADVPCSVERLESGHARLRWPAGGDGRDIKWELTFRSPSSRSRE
ncbi:MAG TPA: glycoside hydrolase family 36 protein [Gemmatimonadales bacterium]|nr:glycoside hydrolase family 36 protein [Gemmatimonadales bacterium]